jgi:hypothetical protein
MIAFPTPVSTYATPNPRPDDRVGIAWLAPSAVLRLSSSIRAEGSVTCVSMRAMFPFGPLRGNHHCPERPRRSNGAAVLVGQPFIWGSS